jgi:hypothetical protein
LCPEAPRSPPRTPSCAPPPRAETPFLRPLSRAQSGRGAPLHPGPAGRAEREVGDGRRSRSRVGVRGAALPLPGCRPGVPDLGRGRGWGHGASIVLGCGGPSGPGAEASHLLASWVASRVPLNFLRGPQGAAATCPPQAGECGGAEVHP